MRTRVKICGFTRASDAIHAAQCGVDAIGLVYYASSPRHVGIAQAQAIVRALPAFVSVVALFVNEQEARIREVLQQVSIDCLQFHGDESPADCRLYDKPYIKAIRMQKNTDVTELATAYSDAAGLLLDAYHPNMQGGSGQVFDWHLIPKNCALSIILAGGLDDTNAKQAIATVKPYALDVSSGVESEKGQKDPLKITAFMRQVIEGEQ